MAVLHQPHPYLPLLRLRDWLESNPGVYTLTDAPMPDDTTSDQEYYNDDILVTAHVIFTGPDSPASRLVQHILDFHDVRESLVLDSTILSSWIRQFIAVDGQLFY